MYSFYIDVHEGRVRITIKEPCGWFRQLLTGQTTRTVAEAYMPRKQAFNLAHSLQAAADRQRKGAMRDGNN